jgi:integral membrane protein
MENTDLKLYKRFLFVGHLEGISYLLLLGIAVPLKYLFHLPQMVRVVGMAHGLLFVAFVYMLTQTMLTYKWKLKTTFFAFVLSLLPFGTFFLNKLNNK